MMLPFYPESIEKLQARYKRALRHIFDCRAGRPRPQPCDLYSCLFDSPDGVRLTISRKLMAEGVYIFFSGRPVPDTEVFKRLKDMGKEGQMALYEIARPRYVDISGDGHVFEFIGFNQEGMPHWRRRDT